MAAARGGALGRAGTGGLAAWLSWWRGGHTRPHPQWSDQRPGTVRRLVSPRPPAAEAACYITAHTPGRLSPTQTRWMAPRPRPVMHRDCNSPRLPKQLAGPVLPQRPQLLFFPRLLRGVRREQPPCLPRCGSSEHLLRAPWDLGLAPHRPRDPPPEARGQLQRAVGFSHDLGWAGTGVSSGYGSATDQL